MVERVVAEMAEFKTKERLEEGKLLLGSKEALFKSPNSLRRVLLGTDQQSKLSDVDSIPSSVSAR